MSPRQVKENMAEKKIDPNMLAALLQKRSYVAEVGSKTGKNVGAALKEVDRQLGQNLRGEKITKSGKDDDYDSSR